MRRLVTFALLALAGGAVPATAQEALNDQAKTKVVASFSILADLVRNVAGDRVEVTALIGRNRDSHAFVPSPADSRRVAAAKLVVVNGLGFEGWLDRLVRAAGSHATVVVASTGVAPREREADETRLGRDRVGVDPHAWQSVANVKRYVVNIRDALIKADPAGQATYTANAGGYLAKLDALDREIRTALAGIPADRRRLISSHDAFGYFADAYGIEFLAPQGLSTDAEPSALAVARIIRRIRSERIGALFVENVVDPRLVRLIARETGARIGGTLYSDALTGPDGPAPTYLDMMRHNVQELVAALGG
jgi:zinc/manganese transport system substrate-binding protein